MNKGWTTVLDDLGVCGEAMSWAEEYATPQMAWEVCQRPAWMLWAIRHSRVSPENFQPLDEKLVVVIEQWALKNVFSHDTYAADKAAERYWNRPTKDILGQPQPAEVAESLAEAAAALAAGAASRALFPAVEAARNLWEEQVRKAKTSEVARAAAEAAWDRLQGLRKETNEAIVNAWTTARDETRTRIAELIRREVPICPALVAQGGGGST